MVTDTELIDALDAIGVDLNYTALWACDIHAALWHNRLQSVQDILKMDKKQANARDDSDFGKGFRPLHIAAYKGNAEICQLLIECGASCNSVTDDGLSPIFFASQQGNKECTQLLLDAGSRVDFVDNVHGLSAVDVASSDEILEIFRSSGSLSIPDVPNPPRIRAVGLSAVYLGWKSVTLENGATSLPPPSSYHFKVFKVVGKEKELIREVKARTKPVPLRLAIRGLEKECKYQFKVAACNALGKSDYSEFSTSAKLPGGPPAPRGVRVTGRGRREISISWSNVTEVTQTKITGVTVGLTITGYIVEFRTSAKRKKSLMSQNDRDVLELRKSLKQSYNNNKLDNIENENEVEETPAGEWEIAEKTTADVNSVTVSTLQIGERYDFRVCALNQAGQGQWSEVIEARTKIPRIIKTKRKKKVNSEIEKTLKLEEDKEIALLKKEASKNNARKRKIQTNRKKKESHSFRLYTNVLARFAGGVEEFPGKISKVRKDGTFDIKYDDGDTETGVAKEFIRVRPMKPKVKGKKQKEKKIKSNQKTEKLESNGKNNKFQFGDEVECNFKGLGEWVR
eukprot:g4980.t1